MTTSQVSLQRLNVVTDDLARVIQQEELAESFTLDGTTYSGRNAVDIYCPREACRCKLLRAGVAMLVTRDAQPLQLNTDSEHQPSSSNTTTDGAFWMVTDVFAFDNMGFSRPVPEQSTKSISTNLRFLCCAECDHGPLGYQDQGAESAHARKECLLAVDRVRYAFTADD
ncbi:Mss4-like protein [Syncephalis plumigaleata]|nr:Mss4-like protein [Syncephalis plumigaleata]